MTQPEPRFLTRDQIERFTTWVWRNSAEREESGMKTTLPGDNQLYDAMIAVANKQIGKTELAALFGEAAEREE